MKLPLLYTFRRCPYAIRARMALHYAHVAHTQIEVDLKNKPAELLHISPKGTVPVLHLPDGTVLEQSLDIMRYALTQSDHDHWQHPEADALIHANDTQFKPLLDRYKYHTRYPEYTQRQHQKNGEIFLSKLENLLTNNHFLLTNHITIADIALFPFIRQWNSADGTFLPQLPKLQAWLEHHLQSRLFTTAMQHGGSANTES